MCMFQVRIRKQVSKVKVKSCEIFRQSKSKKKILGFGIEGFQSKSQTNLKNLLEKIIHMFNTERNVC